MSVCTRVSCGTCFYCDSPVTRHEHDHAPIPQRHGGAVTVVACIMCHSLKDRHPMEKWPLHLVVMASVEIANRGAAFDEPLTDWPDGWADMTGHARVLWAKCAALALDAEAVSH